MDGERGASLWVGVEAEVARVRRPDERCADYDHDDDVAGLARLHKRVELPDGAVEEGVLSGFVALVLHHDFADGFPLRFREVPAVGALLDLLVRELRLVVLCLWGSEQGHSRQLVRGPGNNN